MRRSALFKPQLLLLVVVAGLALLAAPNFAVAQDAGGAAAPAPAPTSALDTLIKYVDYGLIGLLSAASESHSALLEHTYDQALGCPRRVARRKTTATVSSAPVKANACSPTATAPVPTRSQPVISGSCQR